MLEELAFWRCIVWSNLVTSRTSFADIKHYRLHFFSLSPQIDSHTIPQYEGMLHLCYTWIMSTNLFTYSLYKQLRKMSVGCRHQCDYRLPKQFSCVGNGHRVRELHEATERRCWERGKGGAGDMFLLKFRLPDARGYAVFLLECQYNIIELF